MLADFRRGNYHLSQSALPSYGISGLFKKREVLPDELKARLFTGRNGSPEIQEMIAALS